MKQEAPTTLVVLSRLNPYLMLLQVLSILTGLSLLIGPTDSGAMDRQIPGWIQYGWAWGLLISGLLALGAHLRKRNLYKWMGIERGALVMQTGLVLLYGTVLFVVLGWAATLSGGAALAWAGANIWEAALISKDLRHLNIKAE